MSEDGRHPGNSSAISGVREPPVRGSVRILCDEIGFRFDPRLERPEVLVAFVRELVAEVAHARDIAQATATYTGKSPSEGSATVLLLAKEMLSVDTVRGWVGGAEAVHDACHRLNPEDACPTDHLIDMLSLCASAIRFGLDERGLGFSSRHAASAAQHVWRQVYGVSRFDSETPAWENEWARGKLLSAIISLIPPANADTSERSVQARDEPNPSPPEPSAGWRPIESAPRDGTTILVAHSSNGAIFTASWDEAAGGWVDGSTDNYDDLVTYSPSHWMPLPSPPSEATRADQP